MTRKKLHETREGWLMAAVDLMRPVLAEHGAKVPGNVKVSVGFPAGQRGSRGSGGSTGTAIGTCHPKAHSAGAVNHMFIHPKLAGGVDVLNVLFHELIHASDDCESGHGGHFQRVFKATGLGGIPTATTPGDMIDTFKQWNRELGYYPHVAMDNPGPKQGTRMLKVSCNDCGYIARTTKTWLESYGAPICPCNHETMREG